MLLSAAMGTVFLMGLTGGVHCVAMCAAPCAALVGAKPLAPAADADAPVSVPVQWMPRRTAARAVAYHGGRLAGYASVGAVAAFAMESLAWLTQQTMALKPLWTLSHLLVLCWGAFMLMQARQPAWLDRAGRGVWSKVQPAVARPGGVWVAGYLWGLMPCGLLYSAVLVAALSGGPVAGALTMLVFGISSGLWLAAGPFFWKWLKGRVNGVREQWGTRLAGGLLLGMACWALWIDLVYKPSLWCR